MPEAAFTGNGRYCLIKIEDRLWIIQMDIVEVKASIRFGQEISKLFQDRSSSEFDYGVALQFDSEIKILHLFNNHPQAVPEEILIQDDFYTELDLSTLVVSLYQSV